MKTGILLIGITALLSIFSACNIETGEGMIVSESRTVGSFTEVILSSAANVEIVKGDSLKVEVSDYENLIKYIYLVTENEKLYIRTKPQNMVLNNSEALIKITMPDVLQVIELSGSGDINVNDSFGSMKSVTISGSGSVFIHSAEIASTFTAKISGSGNITMNESRFLSDVYGEISGSGDIEISGEGQKVTTKIPGSGHIFFGSLLVQEAVCSISGSGNTTVYPLTTLDANISGSGNIYYYGNPVVTSTITGSGNVLKK